jgi:predicted RNA-binding protein YlxR (DUF448 family)
MANKDEYYYKKELLKIKDQKRSLCSSVPDGAYGSTNNGKNNNEHIKKLKNDLKIKQRALKRSEKQQIDKHINDEIERYFEEEGE